jgi:hypothetical protein
METIQLNNAHELCEYILQALDDTLYSPLVNIPQFAGAIGQLVQNTEDDCSILVGRLFSKTPSIQSLRQIQNRIRTNPAHSSRRAILMTTFAYVKMQSIKQGNSPNTAEMLCEILTLVSTSSYGQCVDGIIEDTPELRNFVETIFFQFCEWQHFHIGAEVLYAYKKLI